MMMRQLFWLGVLGGCVTGADSATSTSADEQDVTGSSPVVINEFTAGSSGKVELYNTSGAAVDVSGWQVDDIANGGYAPKTLAAGTTIAAGGYLVVSYAGINTASADQVRIVDATGLEADSHSNFWTSTSTTGLCFGRQPDGGTWAAASIACTLGATNGCALSGTCDDGNACTTGETYQPGTCGCGGGTQVSCDDGNACTADTCDAATGCGHVTMPDGASCGTGLACQAGACVPAQQSSDAEIVQMGRRDRVLLQGTVVAPTGPFTGEVLVEGDTITCVAATCVQGLFDGTIINTRGIIMPGMIDTHNHILFDIFDETDWSPTKVYTNHNQWPNDTKYKAMVDAKQYLNGEGSPVNVGCEMLKYGEMKGLVAGTTSIQGSANPSDKACYAGLARTIDQGPNGLAADKIQTATIFPSTSAADGVCSNQFAGKTDAYVIHIAEGVDATARAEFSKLFTITTTDGCLYSPKTTIIHGTALGDAELTEVADSGMSLVWSPQSNVFLYGANTDYTKTANIPLALMKGINVALAPDWSIGGSQNLLDELRFADKVDNTVWGNVITPKMLFEMVTINAARALDLGTTLGSIEVGKKADLMVIAGSAAAPYDALLAAHPSDVRLTMVGGVALYGDAQLSRLGPPAPGCEAISICGGGNAKFACVAQQGGTATNKLGQTFAEIQSTLDTSMRAYDALDLTPYDFAPITPVVRCQ